MKENLNLLTIAGCITIIAVTLISAISYYHINDRRLMSTNISEALAKGMDPMSVRCSYASSFDTICVAYAAASTKK